MVLVRTTVGTEAQAGALAARLLDAGAAACVHVARVRSVYDWRGAREDGPEFVVEARATRRQARKARAVMAEGHPYEVPVVESWRVEVNAAYAKWAKGDRR